MNIESILNIAQIIQALVTSLAFTFAGIWATRKFIFYKEDFPRIIFSVDVNFIGIQDGHWLVEVLGLLKNNGQVPHKINRLQYNLRYLNKSDKLVDGNEAINRQVNFFHVLKEGSWLSHNNLKPMIILPDVELRYDHIAKVPLNTSFILIHGWLDYGKSGMVYRADKLVKVPPRNRKNNSEQNEI